MNRDLRTTTDLEGAFTLATSIGEVLHDAAASDWLKGAIVACLERDPVDAGADASFLAALMQTRARLFASVPDPDQYHPQDVEVGYSERDAEQFHGATLYGRGER